jgi:hypothetical protein
MRPIFVMTVIAASVAALTLADVRNLRAENALEWKTTGDWIQWRNVGSNEYTSYPWIEIAMVSPVSILIEFDTSGFIVDFAIKLSVSVYLAGRLVARLSLEGTSAAIRELRFPWRSNGDEQSARAFATRPAQTGLGDPWQLTPPEWRQPWPGSRSYWLFC